MTGNEIAWVAGLLEGEGCFGIMHREKGIRVSCGSTDEDVIDRLVLIVGAGAKHGPRIKVNRKPFYTWDLSVREEVVALLLAILPIMSKRRTAKITELLDWNQRNPKGSHLGPTSKHGSNRMYSFYKCRCEVCRDYQSEYMRKWRANAKVFKAL